MTLLIRKIQSRDVQSVADSLPALDYDTVNMLYIDYLQEKRLTLVAIHKAEEKEDEDQDTAPPIYLACVSVQWQASYSPFWRRNIPTVDTFIVAPDAIALTQALLAALEQAARQQGVSAVGVNIPADETPLNKEILHDSGYHASGSGIRLTEGMLRMAKILTS